MENRINCYKCTHMFITHQSTQPFGCRAYGFKSKVMPSIVVLQSSGLPCALFAQKKPIGGK